MKRHKKEFCAQLVFVIIHAKLPNRKKQKLVATEKYESTELCPGKYYFLSNNSENYNCEKCTRVKFTSNKDTTESILKTEIYIKQIY